MKPRAAESVGIGHPDKIADVIADRLLELLLEQDIEAQFSCEVLTSQDLIVVAGEMSGNFVKNLDVQETVRNILKNLNYDADKFKIAVHLKEQSNDIRSTSIQSSRGIVSGDQSIVVGYATNETKNYLPLVYEVAKFLTRKAEESIKEGSLKGAKYDCKSLVVLDKKEIKMLVFSIQHEADVNLERFKKDVYEKIIKEAINTFGLITDKENFFVNNSGKFVIGGLHADTGTVNRKIVVDSYGTTCSHGGGGYSGKDLTKVDRLGAYYARWICKNLVHAQACNSIELELIFYYGAERPRFFIKYLDSEHTSGRIFKCIEHVFDFSFEEIYRLFNKQGIKYSELALYGHFCNQEVPWEKTDKVGEIKSYLCAYED